jgi:hypothetical protein
MCERIIVDTRLLAETVRLLGPPIALPGIAPAGIPTPPKEARSFREPAALGRSASPWLRADHDQPDVR